MVVNQIIVGIFTREHQDKYQWLVDFLLTISIVRDVRLVCISNNFFAFQQEAERCVFAILYHSNKRGRLNVTDVTDSLYDMELKHLNKTHGKKKVLVVMDDLEHSSDYIKFEILSSQHSINELAEELFLFSTAEKALLMMVAGYQNESELGNKLRHMRRIIEGNTGYFQTPGQGISQWMFIIAIIVLFVILLIALSITMHY